MMSFARLPSFINWACQLFSTVPHMNFLFVIILTVLVIILSRQGTDSNIAAEMVQGRMQSEIIMSIGRRRPVEFHRRRLSCPEMMKGPQQLRQLTTWTAAQRLSLPIKKRFGWQRSKRSRKVTGLSKGGIDRCPLQVTFWELYSPETYVVEACGSFVPRSVVDVCLF
ncbi:hypothetical protein RHMOL_Rhmol06G0040000 [Rhododendron molle]|uniref:Uncharacterized protein n=1 Tax=Rhododendron molle TaxID=49168 RepID=A0ACC0N8L8_RHOML|nr:hypothetical protein RHMOL_Rhmol06G0040000 [Rhododendron molle]